MSRCPVIITPAFIRRHNWRCVGRIFLASSGVASVFLVVFVFAWLLASIATGKRNLDPPVAGFATAFAVVAFLLGLLHLRKHGPQDWEKLARKPDRKPGMRLGRLSNQDYGQIGKGFLGLLLAGPGWVGAIVDNWKAMMPTSDEFADRMESLRQHLAAREAWVPVKDFRTHEADIDLLTRLNIVAIRELQGEWCFRVTVEGTVRRERFSKSGT